MSSSVVSSSSSASGSKANSKPKNADFDEESNMQSMNICTTSTESVNNNIAEKNSRVANLASSASWFVNVFLFVAKVVCVAISGSKSVWAALADSAVDLISQVFNDIRIFKEE
jgi:hypothetical protein